MPSRRMSIERGMNKKRREAKARRDKIVTKGWYIIYSLLKIICAYILSDIIIINLQKFAHENSSFRNWKAAQISHHKIMKHFRGALMIRPPLASPEKRKINSWERRVAGATKLRPVKLAIDVGREENEAEKRVDLPYRPDSAGNF